MRFLVTRLSIYLLTFNLAYSSSAWAVSAPSQARPKDVPWEKMVDPNASAPSLSVPNLSVPGLSVYDARFRYSKLPLDEIPEWNAAPDGLENEAELQKEFERVRDFRFLALPEMKSFLRRIPWLYPDDGCYVRAELATEEMAKDGLSHEGYPVPKKLFVFGDLALKTENSPEGWVYWWYHVAPVVYLKRPTQPTQPTPTGRSEENVYVIDPSMNPKHPIRLKIWVESMIGDTRLSRLSLCDATSYGPSSRCHSNDPDAGAEAAQKAQEDVPRFLRSEWFRIQDLGRDPRKELSDQPPW